MKFEVELEVQHNYPLSPEDEQDVLDLLKKRAKFDGWTRRMHEIAAAPVTVRRVRE